MSSRPTEQAPHTMRAIQQMLGLSRSAISRLVANGFVSPERGPRNEYRFSFRDVVLLRTAYRLQLAEIPTRRILRALQRLRTTLPAELPLSGLRITAVGSTVAVHERDSRWEAESGQLLMDFEVEAERGSVSFVERKAEAGPVALPSTTTTAAERFAAAVALEASDPQAAEQALRELLTLAPDHVDAYLNLGAMLCEAGRLEEAVQLHAEALAHCPDVALLHFNQAVALEDIGSLEAALASYEQALGLDAELADAHFNAARLHDQFGHKQQAIRHFSAYRRLRDR